MSTFDNPFDAKKRLNHSGCACGQHVSQADHDYAASLQVQAVPAESQEMRYEHIVASAVMRKIFPQDVARRAFRKSVGASTALAAVSQFFPLKSANRKEGPQGRLYSDYLRDADHHGQADGLL